MIHIHIIRTILSKYFSKGNAVLAKNKTSHRNHNFWTINKILCNFNRQQEYQMFKLFITCWDECTHDKSCDDYVIGTQ